MATQLTSIAHFAGLEIHGRVMIAPDTTGCGIRNVYFGVPGRCVFVASVTGKARFTNTTSGERIGGIDKLVALVEAQGGAALAAADAAFAAAPARMAA
jgi:hypothetical protein